MPIAIPQFKGKRPKVRPELLDASQAQVAINCDFDRMDITPFKNLSIDAELNSFTVVDSNEDTVLDSNTDTVLAGAGEYMANIGGTWFGFDGDVDVVPAILDNTDSRFYYTGDGIPKQSDFTLTSGGPPFPNSYYRLGVPAPTTALEFYAGHAISAITTANPAQITTSTAHGLTTGDTVYIASVGGMVEITDGTYTVTVVNTTVFTLDGIDSTAYTIYTSGGYINRNDSNTVVNTAYVYTYVTVWGEESAPSPTTDNFDIDYIFGDTVLLDGFLLPADTDLNIDAIRIYRINSGTTSSSYQLIEEIVADNSAQTIDAIAVGSYTYTDSTLEEDLGESIPSTYWDTPPATLSGLITVFNGVLGGFVGNTLYLSNLYYPYAWPSANEIHFPADIVGIGFSMNLIAVLTEGNPYMLLGSDPSTLSKQPLPYPQPCKSKRSIVSTDRGVIYASNLGLFLLTASGGQLLTKEHFTRQQWQALDLTNISATYYNGKYFAVYQGTSTGFIFNVDTGEWTDIDIPEVQLSYVMNDGLQVYIAGQSEMDYSFNAYLWDGGTGFLPIKWKSKKFKTLAAESHSTGKVVTDGTVMVKYYMDGILQHIEMATEDLFRIPSRTRGREFEIEIEGKSNVQSVMIGNTVEEVINA